MPKVPDISDPKKNIPAKAWAVYIVRCADGSFYTGISNDVDKRIATHNAGKGAKYTSRRTPVTLIYSEPSENRSTATKRERIIKKYSRAKKVSLIAGAETKA
ncbi:MAG: GIY-YIG nuclease family protein [Litorimonas sp.]